jgi:nicotinamide mononucleotide transporter
MNEILEFLNVNNTFFTIFNYPMSYVEFFGTILNILTVWLLVKKNIWNWPVGIVAVVLFASLFYQLNLYADLLEQGYYFITGFVGWYLWQKPRNQKLTKRK